MCIGIVDFRKSCSCGVQLIEVYSRDRIECNALEKTLSHDSIGKFHDIKANHTDLQKILLYISTYGIAYRIVRCYFTRTILFFHLSWDNWHACLNAHLMAFQNKKQITVTLFDSCRYHTFHWETKRKSRVLAAIEASISKRNISIAWTDALTKSIFGISKSLSENLFTELRGLILSEKCVYPFGIIREHTHILINKNMQIKTRAETLRIWTQ